MRQSFAISSSAFGRGKKNQCVISVVQKQNLLTATTTQHPPFTKPDGSVSAQHELSRSRCSDPTGWTQMLSRKGKRFGCEEAGKLEYIISGGQETGWRTGAETLQGPLVDWWQVCWWARSDSWAWGSPRPLDRHRRISQIVIIIIIKIQVLFPEE